jgi:hypothetical protein
MFQKYKHIYATEVEDSVPVLVTARRSIAKTSEPAGCAMSLTIDCRVGQQVVGTITSGDIVYDGLSGSTPLNGGRSEYRIKLSTSPVQSVVAEINSIGELNIVDICF